MSKANTLLKLSQDSPNEFNIPDFVILNGTDFEKILRDKKIRKDINLFANNLTESIKTGDFMKFVYNNPFPVVEFHDQILHHVSNNTQIQNKIKSLSKSIPLAIRSSWIEDLDALPNAGAFTTHLNLRTKEEINRAIADVITSYFSAYNYLQLILSAQNTKARQKKYIDIVHSYIKKIENIQVLVQEMPVSKDSTSKPQLPNSIQKQISRNVSKLSELFKYPVDTEWVYSSPQGGISIVAFSHNPKNKLQKETIISASNNLGEAVSSSGKIQEYRVPLSNSKKLKSDINKNLFLLQTRKLHASSSNKSFELDINIKDPNKPFPVEILNNTGSKKIGDIITAPDPDMALSRYYNSANKSLITAVVILRGTSTDHASIVFTQLGVPYAKVNLQTFEQINAQKDSSATNFFVSLKKSSLIYLKSKVGVNVKVVEKLNNNTRKKKLSRNSEKKITLKDIESYLTKSIGKKNFNFSNNTDFHKAIKEIVAKKFLATSDIEKQDHNLYYPQKVDDQQLYLMLENEIILSKKSTPLKARLSLYPKVIQTQQLIYLHSSKKRQKKQSDLIFSKNLLHTLVENYDQLCKLYASESLQISFKTYLPYYNTLKSWFELLVKIIKNTPKYRNKEFILDYCSYLDKELKRMKKTIDFRIELGYNSSWIKRFKNNEQNNIHQLHNNLHQFSIYLTKSIYNISPAKRFSKDIHHHSNTFCPRPNPIIMETFLETDIELGLTVHKASVSIQDKEISCTFTEPPSSRHTHKGRLARVNTVKYLLTEITAKHFKNINFQVVPSFFLGDARIEILINSTKNIPKKTALEIFIHLTAIFESTYQFSGEDNKYFRSYKELCKTLNFNDFYTHLISYKKNLNYKNYPKNLQRNRFSTLTTMMALHSGLFLPILNTSKLNSSKFIQIAEQSLKNIRKMHNKHTSLGAMYVIMFPEDCYKKVIHKNDTPWTTSFLLIHLLARSDMFKRYFNFCLNKGISNTDIRSLWNTNPSKMIQVCNDNYEILQRSFEIFSSHKTSKHSASAFWGCLANKILENKLIAKKELISKLTDTKRSTIYISQDNIDIISSLKKNTQIIDCRYDEEIPIG